MLPTAIWRAAALAERAVEHREQKEEAREEGKGRRGREKKREEGEEGRGGFSWRLSARRIACIILEILSKLRNI